MIDLVERLVLAIGLVLGGWSAYRIANRLILRRAAARPRGLETFRPGVSGVLYFTAPGCQACKTVQQPALRKLREILGEKVQIVQVDASLAPDLADHWGVLSVPTTFIIDSQLRPRRVNHGVARLEKLLAQLKEVEPGVELNTSEEKPLDLVRSAPPIMYNRNKEV